MLSIFMISCSRNEEMDSPLKELSAKDVSFVNYSKVLNGTASNVAAPTGAGVGFEFLLGRKSRNCYGFGICELTAFWIDI